MGVSALTYDSELTDAAHAITDTAMEIHPTSTAFINRSGVSGFTNQTISNQQRSFSGTRTVVELTWTPTTATSPARPTNSDLPLYASIRIGLHSSAQEYDINIWEVSAVPEGGQYPSYSIQAVSYTHLTLPTTRQG